MKTDEKSLLGVEAVIDDNGKIFELNDKHILNKGIFIPLEKIEKTPNDYQLGLYVRMLYLDYLDSL